MFGTVLYFHPSQIFAGKAGQNSIKPFTGLHSNIGLLDLPANIRLGWKLMAVANTLANHDISTITVVKSYIVWAQKNWNK